MRGHATGVPNGIRRQDPAQTIVAGCRGDHVRFKILALVFACLSVAGSAQAHRFSRSAPDSGSPCRPDMPAFGRTSTSTPG